ncbi:uncharacterized protein METZ01_LOCUS171537, partial [marine metagenome]
MRKTIEEIWLADIENRYRDIQIV